MKRAGAALRVEVDALSLLLLVAPKTPAAARRACDFASAVDPPTRGVALAGAARWESTRTCAAPGASSAAAPRPWPASLRCASLGPASSRGSRWRGSPRRTRGTSLSVPGEERCSTAPPRGSRASPKAWVDLALKASRGASALFGGGLDPTIVIVALAGKRLGPSDPDPDRPKFGNLPWWDMLRLNLRGSLLLEISRFRFDLSASSSPAVCGRSERMRATASFVSLRSTFEEFADLEFEDLALEAIGGTPPPPPLPAAAVPRCKLAFVPGPRPGSGSAGSCPGGGPRRTTTCGPSVKEESEHGGGNDGGGGGGGKEGKGSGSGSGSGFVAPVDPAVVYAATTSTA